MFIGEWSASGLGCFISTDHRATLEVVKKKKYHILSLLGIEQ
jgi:hypothetical protein